DRADRRVRERLRLAGTVMERRRHARSRPGLFPERDRRGYRCRTREALAPPNEGSAARGRALGGVPALPPRLPAARGGAAGDARALGELSRLRDRVRYRRARARGSPPAHADRVARAEHCVLDQLVAGPRLGGDVAGYLEHRFRPGIGAHAPAEPELLVLQLQFELGFRWQLLLGMRRGRRRRRWRRLVASSGRCSGTTPSWTARTPSGAATPPRRGASRATRMRSSSPVRPTRSRACSSGATNTMSRSPRAAVA